MKIAPKVKVDHLYCHQGQVVDIRQDRSHYNLRVVAQQVVQFS